MLEHLKNSFNETTTENGAFAHKSTKSDVLDLFALGGSYRTRSDEEVEVLFGKAFAENKLLALKTLFYLRDIRGGQGERRFFKIALKSIADKHPEIVKANLDNIVEFGRYDDMLPLLDTKAKKHVVNHIEEQLRVDMVSDYPSLLAKWMPSNNTSSKETRRYANILAKELNFSPAFYRKTLSKLRKRIGIVETKITEGRFDEIEYDKIPSKAGMMYRNVFFQKDGERYREFIEKVNSGEKKINSSTLYPYEIVGKVLNNRYYDMNVDEKSLLDSMWNNLPNYIGDKKENSIAVVDVSGSMTGTPMEVAISLGMYLAENNEGLFQNHFFTFSSNPQLVQIKGDNLYDKVNFISRADWEMNTDIEAVFTKILDTAIENDLPKDEMIEKLYIISDMQFDRATSSSGWGFRRGEVKTPDKNMFKELEKEFNKHGYELPSLIFWNVDARNDNVPFTKNELGIQLVSGFSPTIFEKLIGAEDLDSYRFMLEVIESDRYNSVTLG